MEHPQIYIIGAGAIGKALAVYLQHADKEVLLVRGSVDNQPATENAITVVDQERQKYREKITITTFNNLSGINGIVLLATKTFANTYIADKLKEIDGDFSIVLLQNGLNIEQPFTAFTEVYRSVLFSTSQVQSDDRVTVKTVTDSPIGAFKGEQSNLDAIVDHINTPSFPFRGESNIEKVVWEKVILNCAFNSICPLLEIDNGVFHRNDDALNLAKTIIGECVALASIYEIKLSRQELEEQLIQISERSNGQLISTYEDIRKKRRTEIESLNLEIARLAEQAGKPEMVSHTRSLGEMIRIKSEFYTHRSQ